MEFRIHLEPHVRRDLGGGLAHQRLMRIAHPFERGAIDAVVGLAERRGLDRLAEGIALEDSLRVIEAFRELPAMAALALDDSFRGEAQQGAPQIAARRAE